MTGISEVSHIGDIVSITFWYMLLKSLHYFHYSDLIIGFCQGITTST